MDSEDQENELVSLLNRALTISDSLSLKFVAIKLSEALDHFWLEKAKLPIPNDSPINTSHQPEQEPEPDS